MGKADDIQEQTIDDFDFRTALESVLSGYFGAPRRIESIERRLSEYSSSYRLEEVDARFDDGAGVQLIFKNLSWHAMLKDARDVKPAFLYNPLREIETYRSILMPQGLSAPLCFGAVAEPRLSRYWLFLERVSGAKIRHVGEFAIWQEVARWLAVMHTRFETDASALKQPSLTHLLRYDADFFRLWMRRAQAFLKQRAPLYGADSLVGFERLATRYEQVVERLVELPQTFIHGDFFASNVLVQETTGGVRVCPVDWEMSGVGPGLLDLAALTSGKWSDEHRRELASAYYASLASHGGRRTSRDEFMSALDCCQLHLAVQWLGWSLKWSPPSDEAQDWLSEALRLAEKLGI